MVAEIAGQPYATDFASGKKSAGSTALKLTDSVKSDGNALKPTGRAQHSATSARVPDFVEPMQAKVVDSMRPGDWIYEIKFDGYRALALRGGSETRICRGTKRIWAKNLPK